MNHGPAMHGNFLLSHLRPNRQIVGYQVALKSKREIAERTMAFTFEKPKDFHFQAGQHVRMTLLGPSETDSKGNRRFLTLANTPQEKELVVAMRMTGSAFKRSLEGLKIGDKVLIEMMVHSAHGSFTLHDDISRPAVFLVGGIGIVPAYVIIKDAIERKLSHKMVLFYSNRRPEDAPYLAELEILRQQNPNLTLVATMTEPEKSAQVWKGETGIINQAMIRKYVSDLERPIYYIAGLSEMVAAMKSLLSTLGIDEANVRAEDFSAVKMQIMTLMPGSWRNYAIPAAISIVVILFIFIHVGATISLYNTALLQNISYLTLGFIVVIFAVKIFAVVKLKHHLTQKRK